MHIFLGCICELEFWREKEGREGLEEYNRLYSRVAFKICPQRGGGTKLFMEQNPLTS